MIMIRRRLRLGARPRHVCRDPGPGRKSCTSGSEAARALRLRAWHRASASDSCHCQCHGLVLSLCRTSSSPGLAAQAGERPGTRSGPSGPTQRPTPAAAGTEFRVTPGPGLLRSCHRMLRSCHRRPGCFDHVIGCSAHKFLAAAQAIHRDIQAKIIKGFSLPRGPGH